jgi:hypothetical protein
MPFIFNGLRKLLGTEGLNVSKSLRKVWNPFATLFCKRRFSNSTKPIRQIPESLKNPLSAAEEPCGSRKCGSKSGYDVHLSAPGSVTREDNVLHIQETWFGNAIVNSPGRAGVGAGQEFGLGSIQ